jgi:EAL domain-containing protein (putative c-di-GMP-specific phosphodiesterase class I)/putative methionine-R-sulfoxide reductase with GAF domain
MAAAYEELIEDVAPSRSVLEDLCRPGRLRAVVQPIVRLGDMVVVGYEALTRVPLQPSRPPDWWLAHASGHELRAELETACWATIGELGPPPDERLLFVNVSPKTLADESLLDLRAALPDRLVIEVTEQEPVEDYSDLRETLAPWLASRVRLAIDDTGAGYSSLRHVIELTPDFLKLDRGIVTGIEHDRHRKAIVRSFVAFAREVGTSVIAEGVETYPELQALRAAGVEYAQGYLFARPGEPWPLIADTDARSTTPATSTATRQQSRREVEDDVALRRRLSEASDATTACDAMVEHLFRQQLMPSVYLERHGQLRCIAQRGLWQVLDGLHAESGITGRTWATGQSFVIDDVRQTPAYLEAIPGVVAEACVPIMLGDRAIGALNVESLCPLPPNPLPRLRMYAQLLARRLAVVGHDPDPSPWQRAATAGARIAAHATDDGLVLGALDALCEAAQTDSACLIDSDPAGPTVVAAAGPLGETFARLGTQELERLASLVDHVSSCYTAGDATDRGFMGTDSLRAAGARAVIVIPLRAGDQRSGTLVLAHTRPIRLQATDIEPLELLTAQVAATLPRIAAPTVTSARVNRS